MRVMVIVKATNNSEAGGMPDPKMLAEMGAFNEELAKAGILLDAAGLTPTSRGARVLFKGDTRRVVHGPFTDSNELVAGYWLWDVASLDEAMEWARRCPHPHPGVDTNIEIRPLYEMSDFE